MKKTILLTLITITLFSVSCSSENTWNQPKDQFKKEDANSSVSEGNDEKGEQNISPWSAIADSCTTVLIENFLNKEKGFFFATPGNIANNSQYIYWQQAHAMDVVVYSYKRIKDSDPRKASVYKAYMELWYENYAHNYETSRRSEGRAGGFFNKYTDDMCWICLTLCHISDALGDDKYIDTAKEVYDKYIITRMTTDDNGSGLPWTSIDGKQGKNSCTNGPACCLATLLYQKYNDAKYLSDAKTLYEYMRRNIVKEDFRCEEPPLSYTQGTFGEACRQLYHITGQKSYLSMAYNVINYAFTSTRCTTDGILRKEGTSMDQSIFKAVLIPYAVNLALDEDLDGLSRLNLRQLLEKNGNALLGNLDRTAWPQMYVNYYWGKKWAPTDDAPYASMGAQTSGASLFEGLCRL